MPWVLFNIVGMRNSWVDWYWMYFLFSSSYIVVSAIFQTFENIYVLNTQRKVIKTEKIDDEYMRATRTMYNSQKHLTNKRQRKEASLAKWSAVIYKLGVRRLDYSKERNGTSPNIKRRFELGIKRLFLTRSSGKSRKKEFWSRDTKVLRYSYV